MSSANSLAAGVKTTLGTTQAAATQSTWRFLNNSRVGLPELVQPLRAAGRAACEETPGEFALLVHDWSRLAYGSHKSKTDRRKLSHAKDIGYDLTTALLVDAEDGSPLAPMQTHLRTARMVYSTAENPPAIEDEHLTQVMPVMEESIQWSLSKRLVHVIDREGDSLGHMREWTAGRHLFLVRCDDDRRVRWHEQNLLIAEIVEELQQQREFQLLRDVLVNDQECCLAVAETSIVLDRPHTTRINGKSKAFRGEPLSLRLVVVQVVNAEQELVSQWTLLTNVPAESADGSLVGLWYYWRWRIESYFKLLKSAGQELEKWQQESGDAIARRLLVASMACVVIWQLQRCSTSEASETRRLLVCLSGRQMKHGVEHTAPSLLAGYFVLLSMADLLKQIDYDFEQLQKILAQATPFNDST